MIRSRTLPKYRRVARGIRHLGRVGGGFGHRSRGHPWPAAEARDVVPRDPAPTAALSTHAAPAPHPREDHQERRAGKSPPPPREGEQGGGTAPGTRPAAPDRLPAASRGPRSPHHGDTGEENRFRAWPGIIPRRKEVLVVLLDDLWNRRTKRSSALAFCSSTSRAKTMWSSCASSMSAIRALVADPIAAIAVCASWSVLTPISLIRWATSCCCAVFSDLVSASYSTTLCFVSVVSLLISNHLGGGLVLQAVDPGLALLDVAFERLGLGQLHLLLLDQFVYTWRSARPVRFPAWCGRRRPVRRRFLFSSSMIPGVPFATTGPSTGFQFADPTASADNVQRAGQGWFRPFLLLFVQHRQLASEPGDHVGLGDQVLQLVVDAGAADPFLAPCFRPLPRAKLCPRAAPTPVFGSGISSNPSGSRGHVYRAP